MTNTIENGPSYPVNEGSKISGDPTNSIGSSSAIGCSTIDEPITDSCPSGDLNRNLNTDLEVDIASVKLKSARRKINLSRKKLELLISKRFKYRQKLVFSELYQLEECKKTLTRPALLRAAKLDKNYYVSINKPITKKDEFLDAMREREWKSTKQKLRDGVIMATWILQNPNVDPRNFNMNTIGNMAVTDNAINQCQAVEIPYSSVQPGNVYRAEIAPPPLLFWFSGVPDMYNHRSSPSNNYGISPFERNYMASCHSPSNAQNYRDNDMQDSFLDNRDADLGNERYHNNYLDSRERSINMSRQMDSYRDQPNQMETYLPERMSPDMYRKMDSYRDQPTQMGSYIQERISPVFNNQRFSYGDGRDQFDTDLRKEQDNIGERNLRFDSRFVNDIPSQNLRDRKSPFDSNLLSEMPLPNINDRTFLDRDIKDRTFLGSGDHLRERSPLTIELRKLESNRRSLLSRQDDISFDRQESLHLRWERQRSPQNSWDRRRSPPSRTDRQRSPPFRADRQRSPPIWSDRHRSPPNRIDRQRSPPSRRDRIKSPLSWRNRQLSPQNSRERRRSPLNVHEGRISHTAHRNETRSPVRRNDHRRSPIRRERERGHPLRGEHQMSPTHRRRFSRSSLSNRVDAQFSHRLERSPRRRSISNSREDTVRFRNINRSPFHERHLEERKGSNNRDQQNVKRDHRSNKVNKPQEETSVKKPLYQNLVTTKIKVQAARKTSNKKLKSSSKAGKETDIPKLLVPKIEIVKEEPQDQALNNDLKCVVVTNVVFTSPLNEDHYKILIDKLSAEMSTQLTSHCFQDFYIFIETTKANAEWIVKNMKDIKIKHVPRVKARAIYGPLPKPITSENVVCIMSTELSKKFMKIHVDTVLDELKDKLKWDIPYIYSVISFENVRHFCFTLHVNCGNDLHVAKKIIETVQKMKHRKRIPKLRGFLKGSLHDIQVFYRNHKIPRDQVLPMLGISDPQLKTSMWIPFHHKPRTRTIVAKIDQASLDYLISKEFKVKVSKITAKKPVTFMLPGVVYQKQIISEFLKKEKDP